jgi:nicotinamidase-related amidase
MARTALFVIDIQNDLALNPRTEIPRATRIRRAASAILKKARRQSSSSADLQIVFVQHEEPPESGDLVRGTFPWGLVFEPREGDARETVVSKNVRKYGTICPVSLRSWINPLPLANTFESNPDLASQLQARGTDTIVTCGIQSDLCVRATIKGALAAGFKVVLLQGAHSTYDDSETDKLAEDIEREVEEELKALGVDVIPWEKWSP